MVEFSKMRTEEVVIVTKQGFRTEMPSVSIAQQYDEGAWKNSVDRIEVKSIFKVYQD